MLDRIEYGKKGVKIEDIPISNSCYYTVNLEKSYFKKNNVDQYFIKVYRTELSKTSCIRENIGYIYFYLDQVCKKSSYIGTYVKPEYRSIGLASLLTAYWIKICLDDGFDFLTTNKVQRKPYLLYILKKYFFEIADTDKYSLSKHTIHICKDGDEEKFLLFKNREMARNFQHGKIYQEDNYKIMFFDDLCNGIVLDDVQNEKNISSNNIQKVLEKVKNRVQLLDSVLLSNIYSLKDSNSAYYLSSQLIDAKDEIQYKSRRL